MQIKTKIRYHITLSILTKIKKLTVPRVREDIDQRDILGTANRSINLYSHFGKQFSITFFFSIIF